MNIRDFKRATLAQTLQKLNKIWTFDHSTTAVLNNFSLTYNVSAALLNNLAAFWELNETSGTRIDSHSTYNLTQVGTVGSTTGKIDNAATFNGVVNNWLGSGHTFDLALNGFTVSTWINGSPLNIGPAVSQWRFGAGMFIGISNAEWGTNTPGNYINFVLGDITDENIYNYYSASFPNPGGWNHVVGVYDPATTSVKLYVNGVLRDSATGVPANVALDGTANFKLGTIDSGNEFGYNGAIDSTGLWLRPLTEIEITNLYNEGNDLAYSNFSTGGVTAITVDWGDGSSEVISSGQTKSHTYGV